ncbi:MAG TPA: hypothetical protein PKH05_15420 [Nitrospira sp.]|nr:hypothetical protein [Nitrospira sp.]MBX3320020.1 hypothetical protein [Nitrospira sp.]HNL90468.1 hypothetical protein [Nitrospira sp.]
MSVLLLDAAVADRRVEIDLRDNHLQSSCCRWRVRRPLCGVWWRRL